MGRPRTTPDSFRATLLAAGAALVACRPEPAPAPPPDPTHDTDRDDDDRVVSYRGGPARPGVGEGPRLTPPIRRGWVSRLADRRRVAGAPLWTSDRLYVALDEPSVSALAPASGEVLWTHELEGGGLKTPVLARGHLLVGTRKGLVGLAPETGEPELLVPTDPVYGAPAIQASLAFVSTTGGVVAVDLDDQSVAWEATTVSAVQSSPALRDGELYVAVANAAIVSIDAASGERRWSVPSGGPVAATPTIGTDLVVFGLKGKQRPDEPIDGVRALRRADGEEAWRVRTKASVTGPLVRDQGRVFFSSHAGRVVCLEVATGREVWSFTAAKPSGAVNSGPLLVEDEIVVVMGALMHGLDAETGERRWKTAVEGAVSAPLASGGGSVFVGTLSGSVYAYGSASR